MQQRWIVARRDGVAVANQIVRAVDDRFTPAIPTQDLLGAIDRFRLAIEMTARAICSWLLDVPAAGWVRNDVALVSRH